MKKLFILLSVVFCITLVACTNASNPNNSNRQEYQNNTTDEHFSLKTQVVLQENWYHYETDINGSWSTVHKRTSGTSGVVGTWTYRNYSEYASQNYDVVLTFNDDGTYERVAKKPDGDAILEGTYEVSKDGDDFYIKIHWSSRVYNLKYLVSDSYFCHQAGSGCPI